MTRHQDSCGTCARLRETAPASDHEDCRDLLALQDLDALHHMRPKRQRPDESKSVTERMAERRAALTPPVTASERPRAGPEQE